MWAKEIFYSPANVDTALNKSIKPLFNEIRTDGQVNVLDFLMLQDVEKEPDEFEQVESSFSVFREFVDDLNVVFVDFENDLFHAVFA
jgi:hypothetical protein